ncbi:hypothetical protein LTR85_011640 [Meristemomyces frigidus]|nr:hypothetical protein LTR85_011640 [Meristemomyces frigidus]
MARFKSSWQPGKGKAKSSNSRAPKAPNGEDGREDDRPSVPVKLQQACLSIFREALKPGDDDNALLQEVKGHLYNRDFAAAFGKEEYLRVYASRWSPSRALGYLQIFSDVQETSLSDEGGETSMQRDGEPLKMVCLGSGGGAELVALAGWLSQIRSKVAETKLSVDMVDVASWSSVMAVLQEQTATPPELSRYASAAAIERNTPMVPASALESCFLQQDLLEQSDTGVAALVGTAKLVTLMFTLNELYSTNMQKTQRLLSHITSAMAPNALLLVVDSPGSYSTVSINGAEKKYPMQWLLDYTLLDAPRKAGSGHQKPKWEKVLADDSRWFRLPQGLQYPIELEDMRYQIHLFRRLGREVEDEE